MAAYFESGFCVRQPSWHRQETLLPDYPGSWAEARTLAGLDWEAEVEDFSLYEAALSPAGIPVNVTKVEDRRRVRRSDTKAILTPPIGVGSGFEVYGNGEMGPFIEEVLRQSNVKYECAGSVKGGATVYVLVRLDEPYKLPGDDSESFSFFAFLNSHDGTGAVKAVYTSVRVVCWNTVQAASLQGDQTGAQIVIRHTASMRDRLETAKSVIGGARQDSAAWIELAGELFGMAADDEAFSNFVSDFLPEPPAGIATDRVRENVAGARRLFKSLYLDSVTCEPHRGTALGLVQAATEYLDHVRPARNPETYMGRSILRPEPLKAKAIAIARKACR